MFEIRCYHLLEYLIIVERIMEEMVKPVFKVKQILQRVIITIGNGNTTQVNFIQTSKKIQDFPVTNLKLHIVR